LPISKQSKSIFVPCAIDSDGQLTALQIAKHIGTKSLTDFFRSILMSGSSTVRTRVLLSRPSTGFRGSKLAV
jgi:hypothetical protein